ncbi:sugar phosphate isomerase/epimerase family protein [Paenibacillus sp. SI8]|uniref:sugar phosphate isomerase/epimerase family protein n=1 Tax=unclassified Paenibacillus TaxID=185978 RepID=UPI003465E379
MTFLSLTSWSLHRNLGPLRWTHWDEQTGRTCTAVQEEPEHLTLLELPSVLAQKGFAAAEICHFHFPDTSEAYLKSLGSAFAEAGIRFYTLLLEYGDISSVDELRRQTDIAWSQRWIDIAAAAGAERVRVIAGDAQPDDQAALKRSADALSSLCDYAAARGVRVVTENFHALTSVSENCLSLIDACGERLGLTSDFGNFQGPRKYEMLAQIVPHSESIHAKSQTDEHGIPDAAEFESCMQIVKQSGYEGPITIVYDGPGDMWDGIDRVRKLVTASLS